ncbi:MAG: PhnD/SsuA/transferrin family substrate-binding protein [Myxococcota bacterium]|nr:PhnD/SsuA/transferrin family substrate-binding protein [Myxococcota bacterium]
MELSFGIYTSDAATEMVKQFAPATAALESALSAELDRPVRVSLKVASTYEGGVNDLIEGRVDFARMGPASYVMAKEMEPGIQLLAMESKKGKKVFYGVICVHADSEIEVLEEIKGERFAFGDSRSTIGRFLAQELLLKNGIGAEDLGGFDYLGRHDKVGMAVGSRMYAAGALKEGTFKKLVAKGEPIRVLARFPNVTKPWIARADLDPTLFVAVQKALLEMTDEKALKALKKDGFLAGEDSDYDPIRSAIGASREFGAES